MAHTRAVVEKGTKKSALLLGEVELVLVEEVGQEAVELVGVVVALLVLELELVLVDLADVPAEEVELAVETEVEVDWLVLVLVLVLEVGRAVTVEEEVAVEMVVIPALWEGAVAATGGPEAENRPL